MRTHWTLITLLLAFKTASQEPCSTPQNDEPSSHDVVRGKIRTIRYSYQALLILQAGKKAPSIRIGIGRIALIRNRKRLLKPK